MPDSEGRMQLHYMGGPLDGELVDISDPMPSEIGNAAWPDGRYVLTAGRYEWRRGIITPPRTPYSGTD